MMTKRLLLTAVSAALLVGCVDTTGLSETSSKGPHPKTNANAAVVVAEYADFQCPACRAAQTAIVAPLIEQMGSKIRYEFHHFPIRSLHRYALEAAEASECMADQGKFWEFTDLDYAKQEDLNSDELLVWAKDLGADMDTFERCIDSGIKRDTVLAEYEAAKALGVTGTPTFFVNGQRVESDLEAIKAAIDAASKGTMQQL